MMKQNKTQFFLFITALLLMGIFVSLFFVIGKGRAIAQSGQVTSGFNTEYVNDPVYTNLKEFSSLPITEERIQKGRTNPFTPFDE